jgi:hypothetical protein
VAAKTAAGVGQLMVGGQPSLLLAMPPQGDERSRSGVEPAFGLDRKLHGPIEQFEQLGLDLDWPLCRPRIQSRQLAVETIDRHLVFEPIDKLQRG